MSFKIAAPLDRWTCPSEPPTALVGDGSPSQVHLHKQISQSISCSDGECSTGEQDSHSYSIGFSIGNGAGGDVKSSLQFLTGGFDVSETYTAGDPYTCDGGEGDIVCVWYRINHTAYTVKETGLGGASCNSDSDSDFSKTFIMRSPNGHDKNTGYYCVRGEGSCRNIGDQYWESGQAGGPADDP